MTSISQVELSIPVRSPVLLDVKDLTVELNTEVSGWCKAVDQVNFEVRQGETIGLVGESGCGKTISMLSLLGLTRGLARVTGSATFEGHDLVRISDRELRRLRGNRIGMIFQQPSRSLNPAFTVGDQIAETIRHHRNVNRKEAWKRAVELLDLLAIPNAVKRANDYPHTFSGGMCQRVMIAIALSCDPALLIADEPTTALDVTVQDSILKLLQRLGLELGVAIILISHDLGIVSRMCERTYIMYAGQVVEAGETVRVLGQPQHPYTEGLLRGLPENAVSGRLRFIPGRVPSLGAFPNGCHFQPRCDYATAGTCDASTPELSGLADRQVRCFRASELLLEGVSVR
jgi:peptide/nickel transport system ATP-binding protein